MVSLIAATGLRIGELLALRWSALDLDGRHAGGARIGVRGQVPAAEDAAGGADDSARAACNRGARGRISARVARERLTDLVFGNRKGDPLRESKLLTNVLQPAAEAAGLGRVTWHQFRHIHSSLLNDLNVPVEDRAGAARARQHFDDTQHLHARRRCIAPQGHRGRRRAVVRRIWTVLDCKSAAGLESATARKSQRSLNLGLEAPPGFEPGMEVLQTSALPLGDGAGWNLCTKEDPAASRSGYNSDGVSRTRRARSSHHYTVRPDVGRLRRAIGGTRDAPES